MYDHCLRSFGKTHRLKTRSCEYAPNRGGCQGNSLEAWELVDSKGFLDFPKICDDLIEHGIHHVCLSSGSCSYENWDVWGCGERGD